MGIAVARWSLCVFLVVAHGAVAASSVVINEVMYHPPNDRDDLQWIEIHNPGTQPINIGGWSFSKGLKFTFNPQTILHANGYLVIARNQAAFTEHYGPNVPVTGDFTGRLSHGGETLELSDAGGTPADAVRYTDTEPWPVSPDGMSASLERIHPGAHGNAPENWAPSELPEAESAAGTPGHANSAALPNVPPVVSQLRASPPRAGQPLSVTVTVADPDGLRTVSLEYQAIHVTPPATTSGPGPGGWTEVPMAKASGTDTRATYAGAIPAVSDGHIVRFRVSAEDQTGAIRVHPHPHDARPSWSVYVGANANSAQVPFAWLVESGPPEAPGASFSSGRPSRRRAATATESREPARGSSSVVYMPVKGGPVQVFDHIRITPRKGGWKVRLHKDRPLDEMTTINVIFEMHPRQVLSEHLAYELYRAAGVPSPLSGHWRVWRNGRLLGYHLYVEQPNSSFLRRNGRDPDGDLFKILWYGQGIEDQHEKKNNPQKDHRELVTLVESLNRSSGDAQWQLIEKHFNVEEFASYYAVNMCIQNWDGFFNNHFVYRAPGDDGKWEIYPWDEDKTWGDHDGASPNYDWYTMPLTMGMSTDRPGMSLRSLFGGGPWGGGAWWRPPGWFSGPLLANPQFRQRFLRRLEALCQTHFTPDAMEVSIARLQIRLEPEIRVRGPGGIEDFHRHIESFRRQVIHRREFILKELARER
jgi:hypothetical protein